MERKEMMKVIFRWSFLAGWLMALPCAAQQVDKEQLAENYAQMVAQRMKEARAYYANADSAEYGVRYLWSYMYDTEARRIFKEDRVVLVTSKVTLDMSYQTIGEWRWMETFSKGKGAVRDSSLAYHLTPSYYYYYPGEKRLKNTYRIITEEFLLSDKVVENRWTIAGEEKRIGGYCCRKAYANIYGRKWVAWFTNDLPYVAAPRYLTGLPGVVLEASDENGEVVWSFNGVVRHGGHGDMYIKYPEKFSEIAADKFPVVLRLFALSAGNNYIQGAGVMNKRTEMFPDKLDPSKGIHACRITNPIELGE